MNLSTDEKLTVVDYLLTTTRSVRKRLDLMRPVEAEVLERCIEIAVQAPSGSNRQGWHFVVVTDAEKRLALAELYRRAFDTYLRGRGQAAPDTRPNAPSASTQRRVTSSAIYLARHLHEVPVHIIPCIEGRVEDSPAFEQAGLYGSILPAVWSLMLALRARGLGSAWTTLHLPFEKEAAQLLNIPDHITQVALLPVAYYTGDTFHPAERIPAREVTYWNGWSQQR
ncbi:MAG TPA: nitroreductase family protein [Caldilineaceae bacterium]|nr:nitroreductase family protein [Caldilineaceae bacterium]